MQGTQHEEPAVVGVGAGLLSLPPQYQRLAISAMIVVAGFVVLTIANPFADALLATGTSLGVDHYLLIQSVVPLATEAPEFVIVAALATLRPEPADAILILAVFLVQLIYPAPFIRFAAGFVLLVFAIDLLCARHRHVRPVLRAAFGRRDAHSNRPA